MKYKHIGMNCGIGTIPRDFKGGRRWLTEKDAVATAVTISALEMIKITLSVVNALLMVITLDILNVSSIGVDDGREIENGIEVDEHEDEQF